MLILFSHMIGIYPLILCVMLVIMLLVLVGVKTGGSRVGGPKLCV
mgnify:CR=1 FL=1